MNTWLLLRIFNWCVGISAFSCCVVGVFFMSKAAALIIT
jgi:hypothetical protein